MSRLVLNRNIERVKALVKRGNHWAKCDLCGENPCTDFHEIYQRSLTLKGTEGRELSYQQEICSWLCRVCHTKAERFDTALDLLRFNVNLYGYEAVGAAIARLQEEVSFQLPFTLEDLLNE